MAPQGMDDLHLFLWYCLQNCSGDGKVNWDAVAVATGSTKGAVAMRYRRLKEKMDSTTSGGASTPINAPATPRTTTSKAPKKSTGSRKRKAPEIKDEEGEEDGNNAGVPQVDGAAEDSPARRQTRGKALNYDLSANFVSDDDMSLASFEKGDTDYILNPIATKSEDEDESFSGSESSVKPNFKRIKKSQPSSFADRLTPTPRMRAENLRQAVIAPPRKVLGRGSTVFQKSAAPANHQEVTSLATQSSNKSTMHPSQKPLPSIESSPSPLSGPGTSTKKLQCIVDSDSEVDVKALRPGALVSFPSKSLPQLSTGAMRKPLVEPQRFFTPITIASSVSSSRDSAGKVLKHNLAEHVLQLELRPEDSISNISFRTAEGGVTTPTTDKGLVSNTFRFFKGFMAPQT